MLGTDISIQHKLTGMRSVSLNYAIIFTWSDELTMSTVVGDNVADRASTFLTTKYMSTHQAHPAEAVYKELVKSVPKLNKGETSAGGGYIDLLLIHAPFGGDKGRAENWAALARAQKEGWVRDIGVSNL